MKTISLENDHPLIVKVLNIKKSEKFTSLRPVNRGEVNECQPYSINARWGSRFDYCEETDTLYTIGYGRYIVYEKGVWFNGNTTNIEIKYEIY